jgi:hypothetical protein
LFCGFCQQGFETQKAEEDAADQAQPDLLADQEIGNEGQAESGNAAIDCIRTGGTQTGNEPGCPPISQGAPYA